MSKSVDIETVKIEMSPGEKRKIEDDAEEEMAKGSLRIKDGLAFEGEEILLPDESREKEYLDQNCRPNFTPLRWIIPLVIVLIIAAVGAIILYTSYRDLTWVTAPIYRWAILLGVLAIVLLCTQLLSGIIMRILRAMMFARAYYFISEIGRSLGFLFWMIVLLPTWYRIVGIDRTLDRIEVEWINKVFFAILYVALARCGKLILDKFVIVQIQKHNFWNNLYNVLWREKVLRSILQPQKKDALNRKLTNIQKAKSRGGPSYGEFKKMVDHMMKPKFLTFESIERLAVSKRVMMAELMTFTDKLFKNLGVESKGYFEMKDIESCFVKKDHVIKAFSIFDVNKDGKASKDEVINVISGILEDRKRLYNTLHDRESIASIVSSSLGVVFWLLAVVLVLLGFGVNLYSLLLPFATTLLGFAFVFGNSLKNCWESLIFIFNVKPYEVGDRITLPTYPNLIVKQINLLFTEFFATDGRLFIIPHSYLIDKPLIQLKRSKDYAVTFTWMLNFDTPSELIQTMIKRIEEWIQRDSKAPWKAPFLWVGDVNEQNKVAANIWVELREINWDSPGQYLVAKTNLVMAVQKICNDLGIKYLSPAIPVTLTKEKDL